jgi:hypothetical protein
VEQSNDKSSWQEIGGLSPPFGNGAASFSVTGIGAAFIRVRFILRASAGADQANISATLRWS